jgi:hypothetical protein
MVPGLNKTATFQTLANSPFVKQSSYELNLYGVNTVMHMTIARQRIGKNIPEFTLSTIE